MRHATLNDLLAQPPSPKTWVALTELLDDWPDDEGLAAAVDEANTALDAGWPDALRLVPEIWLSLLLKRKGLSKRFIPKRGKRGHPALAICRHLEKPSGYKAFAATGSKKLAKEPLFSNITMIDLSCQSLNDAVATPLASSALFDGATHLDLRLNLFTDEGLSALLSAPGLQLRSLVIDGIELPLTAKVLANSPWTPLLQELRVAHCGVESGGEIPLHSLPFRDLVRLQYCGMNLATLADSLPKCTWFSQLVELDLSKNTAVNSAVITALLAEPFEALSVLKLADCPIGDTGLPILRDAGLSALTVLNLDSTQLSDGATRDALAGPWPEGCRTTVWGNNIQPMDAADWLRRFKQMVAELHADPQIKVLNFTVNPPATDVDVAQLGRYFHTVDPDIEAFYRVCNGIQLRWTRLDKKAATASPEGAVHSSDYADHGQTDEDGVFLIESIDTLWSSTKDLVWFDTMNNDDTETVGGCAYGDLQFHRSLRTFERLNCYEWAYLATVSQPFWWIVVASDLNCDFSNWRRTTVSSWLELALKTRADTKLRRAHLRQEHNAWNLPMVRVTAD